MRLKCNSRIPVYFGAGCYWHTNYDMFMVESKPPFSRKGAYITSHVGYGGGPKPGAGGLVCYHGGPQGTLYEDLHFAESTEVILDASQATVQFKALLAEYFKEFQAVRNGKKLRQDPQDAGPPYRNNIGIPGGYRGSLFPLIKAAVPLGLTLVEGKGASDTNDEYQVYIYDTAKFKFYRGEQYHQFHPNVVLGRYVPDSYTVDLKKVQAEAGLIKPTGCPDHNVIKSKDDPKTETRQECYDNIDNDGDGLTDCKDPDCLQDKRIKQRCSFISKKLRGGGH